MVVMIFFSRDDPCLPRSLLSIARPMPARALSLSISLSRRPMRRPMPTARARSLPLSLFLATAYAVAHAYGLPLTASARLEDVWLNDNRLNDNSFVCIFKDPSSISGVKTLSLSHTHILIEVWPQTQVPDE